MARTNSNPADAGENEAADTAAQAADGAGPAAGADAGMTDAAAAPEAVPEGADQAPSGGAAPEPPMAAVRMVSPFAYWSDEEAPVLRQWPAGYVVTDPDEIADLMARKAPFEVHDA